jgi:hypothetical protein
MPAFVVPKACARPSGLSPEKRLAYYRVRQNQVREFEIELVDDYMARALAHRHRAGNME